MVIGTTVFPYLQVACLIAILIAYQASALSPPPALQPQLRRHDGASVASSLASEVMAFCLISAAATAGPAFADEIGVEKDAPTLYTGETIEVRLSASTTLLEQPCPCFASLTTASF